MDELFDLAQEVVLNYYENVVAPYIEKEVLQQVKNEGVLKNYLTSDAFKSELSSVLAQNFDSSKTQELFEALSDNTDSLINEIVHDKIFVLDKGSIVDMLFDANALDQYFGISYYEDEGDEENLSNSMEQLEQLAKDINAQEIILSILRETDIYDHLHFLFEDPQRDAEFFLQYDGVNGGFCLSSWLSNLVE